MLSINFKIKNIDYDSLIKIGLPILKANSIDIDTKKLKNKIIKKTLEPLLKADESSIVEILETIPISLKRFLAIKIITKSHIKIEKFANSLAESQDLILTISNIFVEKEEAENADSLLLGCDIVEIDYNSFIKKFLPTVHFDNTENEMNLFLNALLPALISEYSSIERIINSIDASILERFIVYLINQNKAKIQEFITIRINEKGIKLIIDSMLIERIV